MAEPGRLDDEAVEQRLAALEGLLDKVEQFPGPTSDAAVEAIQVLLEVYGEALARVLETAPPTLQERWCADELLGHLMALHNLHPEPAEARVRRVLDEITADLAERDSRVELLGIEDGSARIALTGEAFRGCGAAGLDEALREAVLALAPELDGVDPVHEAGGGSTALIPVEALLHRPVEARG